MALCWQTWLKQVLIQIYPLRTLLHGKSARRPSVGIRPRHYFASAVTGCAVCCFFFQSPIAARMASSARTEQWIFTGGSESSFTMSIFLIVRASSTVLPLTHSVASDEDAIAEPQPNVLNLASSMTLVSRLTLICSFMTSPHSGAPTRPVPTSALLLSIEPTFRGLE